MWWPLKKKRVPTKHVYLIKDMYTNIVTCVRTCDDESDAFPIKIGLYQGVSIESIYFHLSDVRSQRTQGDIPWCMLFTDDVVLIDDGRIRVDHKLELWR
jgi:hypothetical protein